MRLTTRLLLPLLATVALVMLLFALWALRQREVSTTNEAQRVTAAYATALALGLETALRAGSDEDVQAAIDRISAEPTIFGVIVYDIETRVLFTSQPLSDIQFAPLAAIRRVLATGEPAAFTREIYDQRVYSIVRPLFSQTGDMFGAMEVVQPWAYVRAEMQRTRQRFILNTLTLLLAVTIVIVLLVRRLIAQPLNRFMVAVQALGRGELGYRTPEGPGGAELAALASEFNRMADQIEQAHAQVEQEAESRVALARQLRETEKLAVVGNLAAGLGHEIAAPLHVIRGRAEMLRRRLGDDHASRNLGIITEQIDRITLIVRNLLDFARRREPRLELIRAATLLDGVLEFLAPELDRSGVELVVDIRDNALVRADRDLMHQVFINLMMNAVQVMASQADGTRRLTVRAAVRDASARDERPAVDIDVEDTGPGIDTDIVDRIFEPFFTTKQPGEGTGLGLAVAHSIVEEHGGEIIASTAAGGGARFRIVLPLADPEASHE